MTFLIGFNKIASESEREEYEKANLVADQIRDLPSPSKDPGATDVQVGTRVVYYSADRGWKEGPWARHTKGSCSIQDEQREERKAFEEKVRKELEEKGTERDMRWRIINDRTELAFPHHHSYFGKDWREKAIGIGDKGTVTKVEKFKTQSNRFRVKWDKHPKCDWGNYWSRDLKILPEESDS